LDPDRFPEHDHLKGMEVDIPEGSLVKDLLDRLEIRFRRRVIVNIDGQVKKWNSRIEEGSFIDLFLPLGGG
jgi:sulfur carrier protein ThiS